MEGFIIKLVTRHPETGAPQESAGYLTHDEDQAAAYAADALNFSGAERVNIYRGQNPRMEHETNATGEAERWYATAEDLVCIETLTRPVGKVS